MRSNRHSHLFSEYFGEVYDHLILPAYERMDHLSNGKHSDAFFIFFFGPDEEILRDGKRVTSKLGEKIHRYRDMIQCKVNFEKLGDRDRFEDHLRVNSTESSITPQVEESDFYKNINRVLSVMDHVYWHKKDQFNINNEEYDNLERKLNQGLEKIKKRTLTEEEYKEFCCLPKDNNDDPISTLLYLEQQGIIEKIQY